MRTILLILVFLNSCSPNWESNYNGVWRWWSI